MRRALRLQEKARATGPSRREKNGSAPKSGLFNNKSLVSILNSMKNKCPSTSIRFLALCATCVFTLSACQRGSSQIPAAGQPTQTPTQATASGQQETAQDKKNAALAAVETNLTGAGIPAGDASSIMQKIQTNPERFFSLLGKAAEAADRDPYLLRRVDKRKGLPESYVPADLILLDKTGLSVSRQGHRLRKPAYDALMSMSGAAHKEGVTLLVSSAYRSYQYQTEVFARNVKEMGEKEAERVSARPGSSQHQLGMAIDFGSISDAFAETKASAWLAKNAAAYGFSLSYPQGLEDLTGYVWESWHYRYIGKDAAALQSEYFLGLQCYLIDFLDTYLQARPMQ